MLAYVLALIIGLGSIALYMAAFFFPEVHRKQDFYWSAVGLFYALVLWVCAGRITGGVLLGQVASVVLLGWFAWQTVTLRRALAAPEQQTPIPAELPSKLKNLVPSSFQGIQQRVTGLFKKGKSEASVAAKSVETKLKDTPKPAATTPTPNIEIVDKRDSSPEVPDLVPPKPPAPDLVEAAQKSTTETDSSETATIPIEVIAPEVELAPPAEPPGIGDPEDRIVESETANPLED
jgi:Ycf66 protein N-terminus